WATAILQICWRAPALASFRASESPSEGEHRQGEHMQNAYVASDLLAAVAFWIVALVAAAPAFTIVRQSRRGRARSAVAYLAGFFAGLAASLGLAVAANLLLAADATVFNAGVTAAFIGPFTGIVHAKLKRSARRRPKLAEA